jgi:hypothetical protein
MDMSLPEKLADFMCQLPAQAAANTRSIPLVLQAAKRFGWVKRVNAAGRTATVAWADGGADSEHSVYQLQVGLKVRLQPLVVR